MKKIVFCVTLVAAFLLGPCALAANVGGMEHFQKAKEYEEETFADVAPVAWFFSSVKGCYEYQLMDGTGTGTFDPDGSLTLAQAVAMAARAHQIYTTGENTLQNGQPWYRSYVDYAIANGILSEENSDYDQTASRAQVAALFAAILPEQERGAINAVPSLPDVSSERKERDAIFALYEAGVLTGNDIYGTFCPDSEITRGEAAAILFRLTQPEGRKTLSLYERFAEGPVSFAAPMGTQRTGEGDFAQYACAGARPTFFLYQVGDSSLTWLSIETFAPEALAAFREKGLEAAGGTGEVVATSTVRFGNTLSYRYTLTVTMEGETQTAYSYLFVDGGVLYHACVLSPSEEALETMASSLQVGGQTAH